MKKGIMIFILKSVFLIVFNICFWMFQSGEPSTSLIICYVSVQVSYIALIFIPNFISGNFKVYLGYPLLAIATIYFVLSAIFFGVICFNPIFEYKYILAINLVLLGLYVILTMVYMINNVQIEEKL